MIGLFEHLPGSLPAGIAVVLHMHPLHDSQVAEILPRHSAVRVLEAADGISFESGTAYVAAPDRHLRVGRGRITLDRGPKAQYTRPAIDPLFFSAPEQYEAAVVGVLLSGRGLDGVSGLVTIKQHGGVALVQHPSEAAFPSMPRSAIREDDVDGVLPLAKLADALSRLAEGASLQLNPPPRR